MVKCDVPNCTESIQYLPFTCKYCGRTFCKNHRLPENHNCSFDLKAKNVPSAVPIRSTTIASNRNVPPKVPSEFSRETVRPLRVETPNIRRQQEQNDYSTPFIAPTNTIKYTYIIMIVNGILFFLNIIPYYFSLNIYSLQYLYYYWTLFTSLFIPGEY